MIQVQHDDDQTLEIRCVVAYPNPNPKRLALQLSSNADSVDIEIFSKGMILSARSLQGAAPSGWSQVPLPDEFESLASGVYYARLNAKKGEARTAPKICKLMILK